MRKFTKTLMVTLTALCLSVCFLFAGCSKHVGTYVGTTFLTQKTVELKISLNNEFELTVGDSSTKGTWEASEEDENVLTLKLESSEATATVEEDVLTIDYFGTNTTMLSAVGTKLIKK